MKRSISANPKPKLNKVKRRRQRELMEIQNRGYAAISEFWLRIGVKI